MFFQLLLAATMTISSPPPSMRDIPYIETFHRDGKTLIYVAADHHSPLRYPDAMQDSTFKTIQQVFEKTPPDAVIVEGVDPSRIAGFQKFAKECGAANFNLSGQNCGEPAFAAYAAMQRHLPVYSGEASVRTVLAAFQAHGHSIEDYFAFWVMSYIGFEKGQGRLTKDGFAQMVKRVIQYQNYLLGTSATFTSDDFAKWYAAHMSTPVDYLDLNQEDANPYPSADEPKTLFHQLSAISTKARDENILKTIKTALAKYDRVLVVYGAGHLGFEWDELVHFLGDPKQIKPY